MLPIKAIKAQDAQWEEVESEAGFLHWQILQVVDQHSNSNMHRCNGPYEVCCPMWNQWLYPGVCCSRRLKTLFLRWCNESTMASLVKTVRSMACFCCEMDLPLHACPFPSSVVAFAKPFEVFCDDLVLVISARFLATHNNPLILFARIQKNDHGQNVSLQEALGFSNSTYPIGHSLFNETMAVASWAETMAVGR